MTAITPLGPNAEGVRWDLFAICADVPSARALLEESILASEAFDARYRGRVADLDAAGLGEALAELSRISNALHRIGSYVGLRRSVDVNPQSPNVPQSMAKCLLSSRSAAAPEQALGAVTSGDKLRHPEPSSPLTLDHGLTV